MYEVALAESYKIQLSTMIQVSISFNLTQGIRTLRLKNVREFGTELIHRTAFDSFYLARKNDLVQINLDSVKKENSAVKV